MPSPTRTERPSYPPTVLELAGAAHRAGEVLEDLAREWFCGRLKSNLLGQALRFKALARRAGYTSDDREQPTSEGGGDVTTTPER